MSQANRKAILLMILLAALVLPSLSIVPRAHGQIICLFACVTSITPSTSAATIGESILVSVTVQKGFEVGGDSFSVTLSANGIFIGNQQGTISGQSVTLKFTWNTASFAPGVYQLATQPPCTSGTSQPCNVPPVTLFPLPAGDFSISASPISLTIREETSGSSTITLALISGSAFSGKITLSAAVSPVVKKGLVASLSPVSVTLGANGRGTSTLTVSAGGPTPRGVYTVTMTGVSGTLAHQVQVIVTVTTG
jgi:hypothetical protein